MGWSRRTVGREDAGGVGRFKYGAAIRQQKCSRTGGFGQSVQDNRRLVATSTRGGLVLHVSRVRSAEIDVRSGEVVVVGPAEALAGRRNQPRTERATIEKGAKMFHQSRPSIYEPMIFIIVARLGSFQLGEIRPSIC